ncbi:hypothetical protein Q4Q34_06340 [Flavivirga abyssicola]|uniref:hypothetical protein n=1 Tax=Flavivirga abyssicola TaxID=3063533 RepID=UPI0026E0BDDD|nr:hypothetical protein [Flavivirga sp. MEBiC07777]WVK14646.1 hypothetical protein Q4Q34_06340 [Flavivirga sp. MEBiC07777]
MKREIILLGLFIIFISKLNAQQKESFNTDTHDSYNIKFGVPSKIIKNYTFYNSSSTEYQKSIILYSKNLDTISEKRYKNSEFNAELIFIFNKNRNLIYRSFNSKIPTVGWRFKLTKYKYDENGRIESRTIDKNGNLIDFEIIQNDSLKNKTLSKLFNSNNQLLGYETTQYYYEENKKIWRVYNGSGKKINESVSKIISNKKTKETNNNKYNEYGDCILYPRNWNKNDNTYYQVEYKYDKLGNWTEQKIYAVNKIDGEFKNKKINRNFKRKIKYRK